jgi:hypothetical protein
MFHLFSQFINLVLQGMRITNGMSKPKYLAGFMVMMKMWSFPHPKFPHKRLPTPLTIRVIHQPANDRMGCLWINRRIPAPTCITPNTRQHRADPTMKSMASIDGKFIRRPMSR